MRLKDYQSSALDTLSAYLRVLGAEHAKCADDLMRIEQMAEPTRSRMRALLGDPVADAWREAQKLGLPASPDEWRPLKDGTGRSIPCLKLPTGGGKTLLAAHGVDRTW